MKTATPGQFLSLLWLAATVLLPAACSQNPPTVSTTSSHATVARLGSPVSPATPGIYATAMAAGIAGAEAKTGYAYAAVVPKDTSKPVLIGGEVFGNTDTSFGLDAAAVRFGVDFDGTVLCYSYVYFDSGSWHYFPPASCQMPAASPWPGASLPVVAGSSCANVRKAPGLSGKVITCLKNGTAVSIDNIFPLWVDGHIWWSVNNQQGWMAHDLLISGT